jgi:hypothetical protein
MKKTLLLLIVSFTFFACNKKEETTTPVTTDKPAGTLVTSAPMSGSGSYKVSGNAELYNNNGVWKLYLSNFSSSNGHDLKLYLASDASATTFINLGKLKSTNGDQTYDITGTPDLKTYKYALIWCQQFSVLFGGGQFKQ